jgi:Bacterial Ig-like domain (group 3)
VTSTAKVTPVATTGETPTGTVGFTEGATILAKVQVSPDDGTAAFTTSTLVADTHAIVATYSGDANFDQGVPQKVTATVARR